MPRTIGHIARGKRLLTGQFLFSGVEVTDPRITIWDVGGQTPAVMPEIQETAWLDDLAAVGSRQAGALARVWVLEWINRFGDGEGEGWTPGTTGLRLIRWINHAAFVMQDMTPEEQSIFQRSLAQQTSFLSKRWPAAPRGLRQIAAVTGLIYAALSLDGLNGAATRAIKGLEKTCQALVDAAGAIPTRNPAELLETLDLLILAWQLLSDDGRPVPPGLLDTIERMVPVLRGLRHADGSLARFHGGDTGSEGKLDAALATAGIKSLPGPGLQMGYARATAGRTSLIVDAAPPPSGATSVNGHASTLAFELTSGRRPIIVNAGSGAQFGTAWRRASRATPSHSTMMIDGVSSSHLATEETLIMGDDVLTDLPGEVTCAQTDVSGAKRLELTHDGYRTSHGLTHQRNLRLSADGRRVLGEDLLVARSADDRARLNGFTESEDAAPLIYRLRFHLHPDVSVTLDADAALCHLRLKSGEIWELQAKGQATCELQPSVYFEIGHHTPIACQQVVLSGRAMSYASGVRWSLAKTQDTPEGIRDLAMAGLADDT